jgi:hypothetical protein
MEPTYDDCSGPAVSLAGSLQVEPAVKHSPCRFTALVVLREPCIFMLLQFVHTRELMLVPF